jgi:hypothetical protein
MVKAGSIKLASTAYSNSYSSLTVNWPRPEDGNPPSCITEYLVSVSGVSFGMQLVRRGAGQGGEGRGEEEMRGQEWTPWKPFSLELATPWGRQHAQLHH